MKILEFNAEWPSYIDVNKTTGMPETIFRGAKYLVMDCASEIMRATGLTATHIICHPKHEHHFMAAYDSMLTFQNNGPMPDKFCGMEVIWSSKHGLEVLSDCVL